MMNDNFPLGRSWVGAGPEAESLQNAIVSAIVDQALYQWAAALAVRRYIVASGSAVQLNDGTRLDIATKAVLSYRDGTEGLVMFKGARDWTLYLWSCLSASGAGAPLPLFHVRTEIGKCSTHYGDDRDEGYVVTVECSMFGWILKGLPDLRRGPDDRLVDALLLLQDRGLVPASALEDELAALRGVAAKMRAMKEESDRRWSQMTPEEQAAARQRVRQQVITTSSGS